MKRCRTCGEVKEVEAFYRGAGSHARRGTCKACMQSRKARAQRRQAYHEARENGSVDRRGSYTERNRQRYIEKRRQRERTLKGRAAAAVRGAVRSGKLVKPDACEKCGEISPLQGHHDDYSKPLEVEWLCAFCHGKQHRPAAVKARRHGDGLSASGPESGTRWVWTSERRLSRRRLEEMSQQEWDELDTRLALRTQRSLTVLKGKR